MMSISLLFHLVVLHAVLGSGVGQSLSTDRATGATNVERLIPTPNAEFHRQVPDDDDALVGDPATPHLLDTKAFDSLVRQVMEGEGANLKNPTLECYYRNLLERSYLNFTTETGDKYCPAYYDEIQCWKASTPGNVTMQCPLYLNGIEYSNKSSAIRVCLKNGAWGNANRSDYTGCKAILELHNVGDEIHPFQLSMIGIVGYSISLCSTLGALLILITCKSLWCLRNYIHMNFLISFLIIYLVFFGYLLVVHNVALGTVGRYTCPIMAILMASTTANFCWMLVEGIYLYCTIVRGMTVPLKTLWAYAVIGWVVPVTLAIIDITVRLTSFQGSQTYDNVCMESNNADYIIRIPLVLIVLINVYFLIHIIVVIVRRQRSSTTSDVQQYRKALRALVFLTPLLGVAYLLFLVEPTPDRPTVATHIYRYTLAFLQSTQGFFVALFYVFLNPEVHKLVKRHYASLREDNTLFTNASSRKESKPSLPNIFLFAKSPKDVDRSNAKQPTEGDNNTQPHPPRNGEVPNSSLGNVHVDEPVQTMQMEKDRPDNDVNANNFHRDQRCPETDIESAPFMRHAGYNEETGMQLDVEDGEKSGNLPVRV